MMRFIFNAHTGELEFATDDELSFYRHLDSMTDGVFARFKFVNVSYEVTPAFRQAYLTRAERHETWLMPR